MNLMTVLFFFVTREFVFADQKEEEVEYYRNKIQKLVNLNFGYGFILKLDVSELLDMKLSELKANLVEIYTALDCSYISLIHYHTKIIQSYLMMQNKPKLTYDDIEQYSCEKETQRMLASMHTGKNHGTAKNIMWLYVFYIRIIVHFMNLKDKYYKPYNMYMIAAHQAMIGVIEVFLQHSCINIYYKQNTIKKLTADLTINDETWKKSFVDHCKVVKQQLDFNNKKGLSSTGDHFYSINALCLKGVLDDSSAMTYLYRTFFEVCYLYDNRIIDWNSLEINMDSLDKLQKAIQSDNPSLIDQIEFLVSINSNLASLLEVIMLQMTLLYVKPIVNVLFDDSMNDNLFKQTSYFNKIMYVELSKFVNYLKCKKDTRLLEAIEFINHDMDKLPSLDELKTLQSILNERTERILIELFDGPLLKVICNVKLQLFNGSTAKSIDSADQLNEKLQNIVQKSQNFVAFVKEKVIRFVDFKTIRYFINIKQSVEFRKFKDEYNKEFSKLSN